jgi:hypothetical protein
MIQFEDGELLTQFVKNKRPVESPGGLRSLDHFNLHPD